MPHFGWVCLDPTNNLITHCRHIRTAVGRDYADVPPMQGVFRDTAVSKYCVGVHIEASELPPALDRQLPIPDGWSVLVEHAQQTSRPIVPMFDAQQIQQQQ